MKNNPTTLLITNPTNIRYLSGFTGSSAVVLWKSPLTPLNKGGRPAKRDGGIVLFTDARYTARAKKEAKRGAEIIIQERRSDEALKKQLQTWQTKNLGFEAAYLTVAGLASLKKRLRGFGLKFTPMTDEVEKLRRVKSPAEIKSIAAACTIADSALEATIRQMKRGITERAVAEIFRREAFLRGAEELAFESIVAFGENTSTPHAKPSDRKLKKGDIIQFDIGVKVGGYCSDMSRVFFTAQPTAEQQQVFDAVSASQHAGVQKIRAGAVAGDVDVTCREVLKNVSVVGAGLKPARTKKPACTLDQFFTHSTGHGVGLDIHEWPNNSPDSKDMLECGNVVTVEPGVYLENKFGMRIEDTVVVQKTGANILTQFSKKRRVLAI